MAHTLNMLGAQPDYGNMSFGDLYALRAQAPHDALSQNTLAPYEHQAFARGLVHNNPLLGIPVMLAGIPTYAGAKELLAWQRAHPDIARYTPVPSITSLLGVDHARSAPSINSMAAAYTGMWQGLGDALHDASGWLPWGLRDAAVPVGASAGYFPVPR